MSIDPLGRSQQLEDPQTWNRYTYTLNNPINLTDPLGLEPNDKEKSSRVGRFFKAVGRGVAKFANNIIDRAKTVLLNPQGPEHGVGELIKKDVEDTYNTAVDITVTYQEYLDDPSQLNDAVANSSQDEVIDAVGESTGEVLSGVAAGKITPPLFGPFHRTQPAGLNQLMESTGLVGGQTGRFTRFPQVKAYEGSLPANTPGIEFLTPVKPNGRGLLFGKETVLWDEGYKGVVNIDSETVGIPAKITKRVDEVK